MSTPVADSVRLALPAESADIATLQRRVWAGRVPTDLLAGLSVEQMTRAWHTAITRPPEARYRVLVAVDGARVCGFASTVPSSDADAVAGRDGAVEEFAVDPSARRRGHGSRLLNACVDTLRADGFLRASCWVDSTDEEFRTFLEAAGWAPDGAHRELGAEEQTVDPVRIRQVRLHTDIAPADRPAE